QWYVDTASDSYLVWPYAAADLTATAKNLVTVLDWFPAMDEIVQLWTDGSLRFRRLAHHRSGVWNYESAPRGSIDRSGRYFIYTSNWDGMTNPDGSPRTDVFILRVPLEITGVLKP
ncbi:MAG: hypothetical protein HY692_08025, partial [Cyanobacteria bacterium NC_groundwater_1444_Ag_S-0.65um_54_12]|nr:hypothetical protein [Cyanobacteria bacterium NC_groundwater_1444_Ag_S-0.65um_54_12]